MRALRNGDVVITCKFCGKQSLNGRRPREGRNRGDGSFLFPRLHRIGGSVCEGSYDEGLWDYEADSVTWQVKDFADGWIDVPNRQAAMSLSRQQSGAAIRPKP